MPIFVDIEKRLGDFFLKTSFEIENETLALLGASGCGKSMTLKCIAGIEKPDKGKIILDGVTLFDSEKRINLPVRKRHVGLMFQNYALFPNMTVLQNINAGAKREKDKEKREQSIKKVMNSFELQSLSMRYPHELSGGQQQRVALARIIVSNPDILLLDEPFSALDSHLRFQLEQDVRMVIHDFNKSVIMVSHDRDEVYRMADKVAIMNDGQIDAFGDKKTVFNKPRTKASAKITGCKNISSIKRLSDNQVYAVDWDMKLSVLPADKENDNKKFIGIRMHNISFDKEENAFLCSVVDEIENPFSYTIMLRKSDSENAKPIAMEINKKTWEEKREKEIFISLPKESLFLLE